MPLVVGAGPAGLAAALFCHARGTAVRVIEKRARPSQRSKALAVNPRTLDLLEPTGVTARLLAVGSPIGGAHLHFGHGRVRRISFAGVHPRYPFMLALSQAVTERLLAEALDRFGGRVERGVELRTCRPGRGHVTASLVDAGGETRSVTVPWLLGADGAHSATRTACGIAFDGSELARPWHLADAPLRTDLAADRAHVFFVDRETFVFAIRVVDDATDPAAPVWRVVSNRQHPLERVPNVARAGEVLWESSFQVAHRVAAEFDRDGIYLAGDAAHVHSPLGARGMNLGIEDARVFADLVARGRLDEYARRRRPVDAAVVRRVERATVIADAASPWRRFVRGLAPFALCLPFARGVMRRMVTGLDHGVDLDGVA